MNKKVVTSNNKAKEEPHPKKEIKRQNKEINLHIVRHIKGHLGVETLKDIHISNILNLKVKDIEDIEIGSRELSLKDTSIICKTYKINPDNIFEDLLKNKIFK